MSDAAGIVFGRREDGLSAVWNPWDASHLAVQGQTRSGKSVLMYHLLSSLAHRSDVVVCGVDPSGLLLAPWRGLRPEFTHIGGRDMSHAAKVLGNLVNEMDARIERLLGTDQDQVREFSESNPQLVVVLEEYPGLLSAAKSDDEAEGRKVGARAAPIIVRHVSRLVQESAKVGIRLVLIAQRMEASIVGGSERSNFGTRISMRVDNGESVRMLHPRAEPELIQQVSLFQPGVMILDQPGEPLCLARSDFCDYQMYLERVRRFISPSVVGDQVRFERGLSVDE